MPVAVQCRCGRSYQLKAEFAGCIVQCPHCDENLQVPALPVPPVQAARPQADPAFDRDSFLLRQQHLTINEKYVVWDEEGRPILFIERPSHLFRGVLDMTKDPTRSLDRRIALAIGVMLDTGEQR